MSAILSARSITREVATTAGLLTILNQLDLEVFEGESVAIQGASGSGKSTLLSLLAGLDLPQSGKIIIDGHAVCELNEDQRARLRASKVGFVFQSFYLIDDLTALENVAMPLELFGRKQAIEVAKHWLTKLGMAGRLHHFPNQLSGGEQQRVALCRGFAVEPSILFADEPTANLDMATAQRVLDQLFRLQKEQNISMLIATHDHSLAQRCDRVLEIHQGRIVESARA